MSPFLAHTQVFKALRGGVQDVAVKQLLQQEDGHLEEFVKACSRRELCL